MPLVEALAARHGTLPLVERLSGVVQARNQVAIRAEVAAPVVEVLVESGEAVERGQPLVRLQDDRMRDQLRQAEASLRLAQGAAAEARARVAELEAQVVRTRKLAEEELVSALELETQEAQLAAVQASAEQAEAQVDEARAAMAERQTATRETVVRAPVAGRVGQRHVEVGMLVSPETLLFEIGDLDQVIVEVPLTQRMLGYLETRQPVRILSETFEEPIEARLSRISPFLAAGSFSTVGEIDVDNTAGKLRPGMFVTVDVLYGESEQATLVPTTALWEDPRTGVVGVFVVDLPATTEQAAAPAPTEDAHAVALRPVEVLAEGQAMIGVEGVAPGEWVVTVGQHLLAQDGAARARVRPTSWEQVLALQELQREDLLASFLAKQQRLAKSRGAAPPTNEEFLSETSPVGPVSDFSEGPSGGARTDPWLAEGRASVHGAARSPTRRTEGA